MATKSVAANAFRWAAPTIERLIQYEPRSSLDFLQADLATKHYVALAVRGWEVTHDRSDAVLHRLALELFSHPRTTVLRRCGVSVSGSLRCCVDCPVASSRDPRTIGLSQRWRTRTRAAYSAKP